TVQVMSPNGGENLTGSSPVALTWSASDNVGVTSVDVLLSRAGPDGPYETLAHGVPNTGTYSWNVTGPSTTNAYVMVQAWDAAGNTRADASDAPFSVTVTAAVESGP